VDQSTRQPLPGANVYVKRLDRGTATRSDGRFALANLPTGTYMVHVSMVGYEDAVRGPVPVTSGRPRQLSVALPPKVVQTEGVTVTASHFQTDTDAPTSVRTLEAEEIRRAPGAAGDVQRVMQAMPGVAVGNDRRNDLIVRGGSPRENLILLDGIEVPNLSHFGTQGATGGPISMLDSDFLDDATFLTGGFPARYGGALSSVLQLSLREGSRQQVHGSVDLSMAGAGGSAEGPIPGADGAQGSWFVGGRRSYLDLIQSGIGLTAVPQYSSGQAKAVYDLSPSDRLTAIGLAGRHSIRFESDSTAARTQNGGDRFVGGLTWRHLWGDVGTSTLTASVVSSTFRTDSYDEQEALDYRNRSRETIYSARLTSTWRLTPATTLDAGGTLRVIDYRHDLFREPDTTNTGTVRPTLDETTGATPVQPDLYAQLTHRPIERLSLTAGVRASAFSLSDHPYTVSPRLSARFELTPSLALNAAWGRYYQRPELVWFTATDTADDLAPTYATHWIAGLEWTPGSAWRVTLEGYRKDYGNVPSFVERPMLSTINQGTGYGAFTVGPLSDAGTAHAQGLEAFARRRLTDRFHATVSYTLSEARYTPLDGVERPTSHDVRHMTTVILGASAVDTGPLGLLGGSVKLRYASGQPTTPYDRAASRALDRGIIDTDRVNARRLPDYLRVDVRLDRRDHFSWGTVTSYVEMQNVTGRRNVAARLYDADTHTVEDVTHWGRFFVGGVKVEI
jgi:outer membrane receptor for ferrienterochelin and colicin